MSTLLIGAVCPDYQNDPEKIEQMVIKFESLIGKDFFGFYINEEGIPLKIEEGERIELIRNYLLKQKLPLLCNGVEETLSTLSGYALNINYGLIKQFLILSFEIDKNFISSEESESLELIGDSLNCYRAGINSSQFSNPVRKQKQFNNVRTTPPLGLPPLADLNKFDISPADRPSYFSWINYWSNSVAEEMGFKYEKDKSFFDICYPTKKGWLLQITKEPLNLEIPEHLEKLKATYSRFKKVGGQDLLT